MLEEQVVTEVNHIFCQHLQLEQVADLEVSEDQIIVMQVMLVDLEALY